MENNSFYADTQKSNFRFSKILCSKKYQLSLCMEFSKLFGKISKQKSALIFDEPKHSIFNWV